MSGFDAYLRDVLTGLRSTGRISDRAAKRLVDEHLLRISSAYRARRPAAQVSRALGSRFGFSSGQHSVRAAVGCKVAPIEAFFVEPEDLPPLPTCRLRPRSGLVAGGFDVHERARPVGQREFEQELSRVLGGDEVSLEELADVYSVKVDGGFQRARPTRLLTAKNAAAVVFDVDTGARDTGIISVRFFRHKHRAHVYVDLYDISSETDSQVAKGLGAAAMRKAIPWYRASHIDSVLLFAAWVGRYVWASFGFTWDDREADKKAEELAAYLDKHKQALMPAGWFESTTKRVDFRGDVAHWQDLIEVAADGEFTQESWRAASLHLLDRAGNEAHVGKGFLMGTHLGGRRFAEDDPGASAWNGELDLDPKSTSYQRAARRLKL